MGHVVEDVFHGTAMGQWTGLHFSIGLFPPLALMCMEQQDQLLLNEFALLRVSCWTCWHTTSPRYHAHWAYLLLQLGLQENNKIPLGFFVNIKWKAKKKKNHNSQKGNSCDTIGSKVREVTSRNYVAWWTSHYSPGLRSSSALRWWSKRAADDTISW